MWITPSAKWKIWSNYNMDWQTASWSVAKTLSLPVISRPMIPISIPTISVIPVSAMRHDGGQCDGTVLDRSPRSGEIIQASVYMYHDVLKLLHNWKFVQTAQVMIRKPGLPFSTKKRWEWFALCRSHEIGHTLGLMHNMRASYSIPVDLPNSPAFTAKYGTTTSIMDYARNNCVAQPEDKNVRLIPPLLGVYDIFMIKLGYAPIYDAETPADEYATLLAWNKWIQEKRATRCIPMVFSNREPLDPASQSESLGDDAVKASRYGIKNLRYIMDHLVEMECN